MIDLHRKSYPTAHIMTDIDSQLAHVPESLQMFLRPIVKTKEGVPFEDRTLKLVDIG